MLSTSAITGLNPELLRSSGNRVTGAPHDLQKLASATTIGCPHREQNLGFSKSASATEDKLRVAEAHGLAVAQTCWLGHPPITDERPVLAVKIPHHEAPIGIFDTRVMPRDRGMTHNDFIVERAPDSGNGAGAHGVGLPRRIDEAWPIDFRIGSRQPRGDMRRIHRVG